jgi:hypothetical protein
VPTCTKARTPSATRASASWRNRTGSTRCRPARVRMASGVARVGRQAGGRPQRNRRRHQRDGPELLGQAGEVGLEERRVEARPERQLLGQHLALPGPLQHRSHGGLGRAHHRLVGAVVVGHVGVRQPGHQLGGHVGAGAEGHEHHVGHLDRTRLQGGEELVDRRSGDHPRHDLAGPLPQAVPGQGVGADARAGRGRRPAADRRPRCRGPGPAARPGRGSRPSQAIPNRSATSSTRGSNTGSTPGNTNATLPPDGHQAVRVEPHVVAAPEGRAPLQHLAGQGEAAVVGGHDGQPGRPAGGHPQHGLAPGSTRRAVPAGRRRRPRPAAARPPRRWRPRPDRRPNVGVGSPAGGPAGGGRLEIPGGTSSGAQAGGFGQHHVGVDAPEAEGVHPGQARGSSPSQGSAPRRSAGTGCRPPRRPAPPRAGWAAARRGTPPGPP